MSESDPTTARAQRAQAVREGVADDAVDRTSGGANPGVRDRRTPSRDRQEQTAREVAEEIDISREGVGTVDRIGGLDVFLRSTGAQQFGRNVSQDFASEADFVTSEDVNARVDQDAIAARPLVAQDRRDDVRERARTETAADAQFIERRDVAADVGPRGVSNVRVRERRQDDVASRARSELAGEDPFAQPSDFAVDVTSQGVERAALSESGARRRAGRVFESRTPLESVDPSSDVTETDDGLALTQSAQRRAGAEQLEAQTPFDELDPQSDIRDTADGFALAEGPQRELAADRLEDQTRLTDVNPSSDVTAAGDSFALADPAQRRLAAQQFDADTPVDVSPDDVVLGDSGARLTQQTQREIGAEQLDAQLPGQTVTPGDVELNETDDGLQAVFETTKDS
mgnify:CR=1 FL=1